MVKLYDRHFDQYSTQLNSTKFCTGCPSVTGFNLKHWLSHTKHFMALDPHICETLPLMLHHNSFTHMSKALFRCHHENEQNHQLPIYVPSLFWSPLCRRLPSKLSTNLAKTNNSRGLYKQQSNYYKRLHKVTRLNCCGLWFLLLYIVFCQLGPIV